MKQLSDIINEKLKINKNIAKDKNLDLDLKYKNYSYSEFYNIFNDLIKPKCNSIKNKSTETIFSDYILYEYHISKEEFSYELIDYNTSNVPSLTLKDLCIELEEPEIRMPQTRNCSILPQVHATLIYDEIWAYSILDFTSTKKRNRYILIILISKTEERNLFLFKMHK